MAFSIFFLIVSRGSHLNCKFFVQIRVKVTTGKIIDGAFKIVSKVLSMKEPLIKDKIYAATRG